MISRACRGLFPALKRAFVATLLVLAGSLSFAQADPPAGAVVSVDFGRTFSVIPSAVFGTNDLDSVKPAPAGDERYQELMAQMGITMVRIHLFGLMNKIFPTREAPGDFHLLDVMDRTFLRPDRKNTKILFCFTREPKWADLTKEDDRRAYAERCVRLAEYIVNVRKYPITLWEFANEPYAKAFAPDRSYWKFYLELATRLHRALPGSQVGGPCLAYPSLHLMADFLQQCGPQVDFISWHLYPSGTTELPTDVLMNRTAKFGDDVRNIRALAEKCLPNRPVPLILGEYNMNWNWRPTDPRQATVIGAVWDASVLKHIIDAGVDMAMTWQSKGTGTFGLVSDKDELRSAGELMAWMNRWFAGGRRVASDSSQPGVEALAARGIRSDVVLLINKTAAPVPVTLQLQDSTAPKGFSDHLAEWHQMAQGQPATGGTTTPSVPGPLKMVLPAYSLRLYLFGRT